MSILSRRIAELIGLATIGDGMMAVLKPKEHAALWRGGPQWWDGMIFRGSAAIDARAGRCRCGLRRLARGAAGKL